MADDNFERKLTAILYADVAGYSRLTGQDETGTHRVLSASLDVITSCITENDGRVVHFAGDAILAEFSSVRAAVNAAVVAQCQLRDRNRDLADDEKLQFRIGINLGEVIVDRDDIFGDGVNVAARLEALADPGGICISGPVHDQIDGRLPLAFHDMGGQKVKNITKPIRAYKVLIDDEAKAAARSADFWRALKSPKVLVSAAASLAIIIGGALFGSGLLNLNIDVDTASPATANGTMRLADKPAIAVLPFANLSGDSSQEYLSDGITEDVITNLGRSPALFVISRNSTFAYKGKAVSVADVSKSLGARYVVDGSFRRSGDKVRVSAQLVDASNELVLWSDRFDRDVVEIFAVQDEIAGRISAALSREVKGAEALRGTRKKTQNVEAYDLVLQARRIIEKPGPQPTSQAIRLLERAIALDPGYAQAHASLARTYLKSTRGQPPEKRQEIVEQARAAAEKALELDPGDFYAHWSMGLVWSRLREPEKSLAEFQNALKLNPNEAELHLSMVRTLLAAGRKREALHAALTALRLNPYHSPNYEMTLGLTHFNMENYEAAVPPLERAISLLPKSAIGPRMMTAAAYVMVDRVSDAQKIVAETETRGPSLDTHVASRFYRFASQEEQGILRDALRRAGVPSLTN